MPPEKSERLKPEHISESSPEYKENREEVQSYYPSVVFGEIELRNIDSLRKKLKNTKNRISLKTKLKVSTEEDEKICLDIQKKIDEGFGRLKSKLKKALHSSDKNTTPFLSEALDIPEIAHKVSTNEDLQPRTSEYTEELRLGTLILKDCFNNDEIEKIVQRHIALYFEQTEKLNRIVPEIFARFRDSVLESIKQKYLPITQETLESRIGAVRVVLGDPLIMKHRSLATHDSRLDLVEVSQRHETIESIEESIFHELVHALSGKTIIMNNKQDDIMLDVKHQRSGLSFKKVGPDGSYIGQQLKWLNEAVTETIASHLVKRETFAYRKERLALETLFEKGLSRDVLYKAYFENYEPASKDKVPAWKEFTQEVNKLYPETGIQELIKIGDTL